MKQSIPTRRDVRRIEMGGPRPKALVQSTTRVPAGHVTARAAWLIDLVHNQKAIHRHGGYLKFDIVDPDTGQLIRAKDDQAKAECGTPLTKAQNNAKRRYRRRKAKATKAEEFRKALLAAYSALRTT